MNDDLFNSAMPPDEQLVAYLDGELDPESRRRIEEQLVADAQLRRRLQELEHTWELLDDLDTAPVGDKFTQSTLEMVAIAAGKDVEQDMAEAPRRRRRAALIVAVALLTAAVLGFLAVVLFLPDPNQKLLQILPLLENLDQYRQIDDIAFLHLLAREGLFAKESSEAPTKASMPPGDALQRIENMDMEQKGQLLRRKEQFDALSKDQQQRLQDLDHALSKDTNAPQLRQIMRRYYEWLKTSPSYTRAELAELNPADRLESVKKQLKQEQAREGGRLPGGEDMKKLDTGLIEWVKRRQAQIVLTLSESQKKRYTESTAVMRQRMLLMQMMQQWREAGRNQPPPLMTDEDLKRLRERLSPETRKRLESQPPAKQWQMIAHWMRQQRFSHGPLPKADDERLAKFFEKDLTDEERDRLMNMPGEEMQRALQQLYWTRRSRDGQGRWPEGPRHEPWPGQRPPPKGLKN